MNVGHLVTVFVMCRYVFPPRCMPLDLRNLVGRINGNGGRVKFDIDDDSDGGAICVQWSGNLNELDPPAMRECACGLAGHAAGLEETMERNGWVS